MSFMASYKHLEKLCGELLDDDRRVSAYIEAMLREPNGPLLVDGWNSDLMHLKHYRHIRNQIVHDPGCTEENMCEPGDEEWLDDFYDRIMTQTDPLALYRKAIGPRSAASEAPSRKNAALRSIGPDASYSGHIGRKKHIDIGRRPELYDQPNRTGNNIGMIVFASVALLALVIYVILSYLSA